MIQNSPVKPKDDNGFVEANVGAGVETGVDADAVAGADTDAEGDIDLTAFAELKGFGRFVSISKDSKFRPPPPAVSVLDLPPATLPLSKDNNGTTVLRTCWKCAITCSIGDGLL